MDTKILNHPTDPQPAAKRSFFSQPAAWGVLILALAASAGGWFISRMHAELGARKQFDEQAGRVRMALTERMLIYQDVLHGAVGLYAASRSVERAELRAYLQSVSIEKRYPGIDGVGFIANVPRSQLNEFLRITRADQAADFELKNLTDSTNDLLIIKYIEPEERHRALLGWDMSGDPERRAVAQRARDTGDAAMTGTIRMMDNGREAQRGFLMLLPVYQRGTPVGTESERRANLEGWVYGLFISDQLMRGILENQSMRLGFEVFDGLTPDPDKLVFAAAQPSGAKPGYRPRFSDVVPVKLAGHSWTLRFTTTPAFDATIPRDLSRLVGASGGLISLLLFGIAWSLSRTRERALAMASDMTASLRETNQKLQQEMNDRRRAEQASKDSEALYHSLVETLPLHILRKDLQGRFTFANQRFCNDVGKSLKEIVGKTDFDLFPPDVAEPRRQQDQRVIETGGTDETVEELRVSGEPNRFLQMIKTPVCDGQGAVIGILGIYWDVSDKRRAAAELEHERFLLRTLMEHLPDRIYFKDRASRFLRNSRAHLQRFGLTEAEQAIGKTDFDFFTEEHARQAYNDEQELMRVATPITKEEKETWPDGSVSWALSTKMPLRDEHGRIVGTFGISRDITDRKRAEEAMRQAKEAAEEASRIKSQFLASMSHELRTPLNSVIGFANILLKNKAGNLGPAELNFLDRIQANGKHLLGLINEILDLSKIEARKVELQIAPVALDVLVRETIAQQEGLVRDRPVKLLAEVPATVAPIQTDADKLKQVIINLIGNALKFTEYGSVTVRVVTDPADQQPLRIEVIDTGIGIPPEKLKVIFEAFQQADASTARKYGGTGLGLTISQALCQLMGYRIAVTSTVGVGSTFSVELKPAGSAKAGAAVVPSDGLASAPLPVDLKDKLVLVIDDESDSRTLLTHLLEEFGCQVIAANSGEQGLRMAREFRPQIITVDLLMPNLNGWQVVQAIKAEPQLRDIPVVVVSVVASENRGRILGAVDVLQKPVTREELIAVLHRAPHPRKPRVLVVDDEADARRILTSYLEEESAEVYTANNGREALIALENFTPDLILLDLMMPVMDGVGFLSVIRADPRSRHLRVAVITAKELTPEEVEQLQKETLRVLNKAEVFEGDFKRLLEEMLHDMRNNPAPPTTGGSTQ
jgi:two-component system sensor histidine kinase/response regulator